MCLSITSLNSGSNGNCYYIGNDKEAILVDAGISCRETEKRMKRLGLQMEKVKAIFISHEHGDHIAGIVVLARKFQLPVYITTLTVTNGRLPLEKTSIISFEAHKPVLIGGLSVTAFPKFHDASDPHSFMVSCKGVNVGIFTDIGIVCKQVIHYFQQCHAAFLEANYDEAMLENGSYPYHLKKRISGGMGHLSNTQALELFKTYRPSFMSHLLLSHLSKNNNDPLLVQSLFNKYAGNTQIIVATRYKETDVYPVQYGETVRIPTARRIHKKMFTHRAQLSLF